MGRSTLDALTKALRPKCLNCGVKDAKVLPAFQPAHNKAIFCTVNCAAHAGLGISEKLELQWCPRHEKWHSEEEQRECREEQEARLTDPRIPLE